MRQQARQKALHAWLRWEAETQARWEAAQPPEEPPPPPPEGTPERREWEERYAQLPREGMSLAEWKQYDNQQLARYEREQANQAFQATPARLEARGGYTLDDPIRRRHAARYEAGVESTALTSQVSPGQRFGTWVAGIGDKIVEGATGLRQALRVRHLKFTRLDDGYVSVRAETPSGTREAYRALVAEEGFEFYGTRYAARTVAARTAGGLWRNALSKGSWVLAGVVALGQNLWQYGTDPSQGATFIDRTVKNRAFWVSTGVDFALGVAVGAAAAAVVGGAIALLAGTAIGTVLAMPAVAIGATLIVGLGIGWGLDALRVPDKLKAMLNK